MKSDDTNVKDKVCVVGHLAQDYISLIPHFPKRNHSVYITKGGTYFGGGAGNIAVGIASLGGKCKIVSSVGHDFKQSNYEKHLKALHIELRLLRLPEPTACAYIFIDKKSNQVTYFSWGASRGIMDIKPRHYKFLHIAPCSPIVCKSFVRSADFVAFEPGQDLPKFDPVTLRYCIKNSHILFCNNYELRQITHILDLPEDDIYQLSGTTLVTRGKKGSELHNGDRVHHIRAIPADIVDPTGAGDGYRAGFWVGKLRKYDDLTACRLGSIVSSFIVTRLGAQTNIPPWEKIIQTYATYFGDLGRQ